MELVGGKLCLRDVGESRKLEGGVKSSEDNLEEKKRKGKKRELNVLLKCWYGEHKWKPIFNKDYSKDFTNRCRKYPHCLDATCNKLVGIDMIQKDPNLKGNTAISEDLFMPTGYYTDQDSIDIVFLL